MAPRNVFVVGPTDLHWEELATVEGFGDRVLFHALLDAHEVAHVDEIRIADLLGKARKTLDDFDGPIDGIIAHWDFPTTLLVPLLCREHGLRAPSLKAVLCCGHKYWSRKAQQEAIPEVTPAFALVDPFAEDAVDSIDLAYPYWLKPVKGFASHLGFRIDSRADLEEALATIRSRICRLAVPFDQLLVEAGLPEEVRRIGGAYCIAEEYLGGVEIAHEGHVQGGRVTIHGTLDMIREEESFTRYLWPSDMPKRVLDRMEDATRRFLEHIDFDDGCFNAEYFWDRDTDRLAVIEFNPRISQSHAPLCILVDGRTNHEVATDVALGEKPRFQPGAGPCAKAAKFLDRTTRDGVVRRVPTPEEIAAAGRDFPTATPAIDLKVGERLSEQLDQDAYTFLVLEVYLGGDDAEDLVRKHARYIQRLPLEIEGLTLPDDLVGVEPEAV